MKRYLPVVILASSLGLAADPPDQARRGEALFALKSASGYSCTTCHQLGGRAGNGCGAGFEEHLPASSPSRGDGDSRHPDTVRH